MKATQQAEQLSGGIVTGLTRLRKQLGNSELLREAFDTAKGLLPDLQRLAPTVVPKLANVFYWAIVGGGHPDDLGRYRKLFGAPVDDPNFDRLQALILEMLHDSEQAHQFWGRYQQWIAAHPERWPGGQCERAQADIFVRMGILAQDYLESEDLDEDDFSSPFDFIFAPQKKPSKPKKKVPLSPSPEECYRRSFELTPTWVTPGVELLQLLQEAERIPEAAQVAEQLLQRFPTDLQVLDKAANFFSATEQPTKALECVKKALQTNPLDRRLRERVAVASLNDARGRGLVGEFEAARAALKEAHNLSGSTFGTLLEAISAAIERRAGQLALAEKQEQELRAKPHQRVASAYRLYVEHTRLKLAKKSTTPFSNAFSDSLKTALTVPEAFALLEALGQYLSEGSAYYGLKSHTTRILQCVEKMLTPVRTTDELLEFGFLMQRWQLWKGLKTVAYVGMSKDHENPYFRFFLAEATLGPSRAQQVTPRIGSLYYQVKKAIEGNNSERYRRLQELLDERCRKTPEVESFFSRFDFGSAW